MLPFAVIGLALTWLVIPSNPSTSEEGDTASNNLGSILGAGISGAVLLRSDYPLIGVVLGLIGVMSALVIRLFASDPTEE